MVADSVVSLTNRDCPAKKRNPKQKQVIGRLLGPLPPGMRECFEKNALFGGAAVPSAREVPCHCDCHCHYRCRHC
jgi:hypothetical protein